MSLSSPTASDSRSSSPHTPDRRVSTWSTPMKPEWEETEMLRLDDLLEQHAFDDSAPTHFTQQTPLQPSQFVLVPSHNGPVSVTKPIPPPASIPRKVDVISNNHRIVHPPKESCFNLPIMFPSIPEAGTKSRVETQVRVTVDLADPSSSSDPHKYDRVGSWKWLKLPPGSSTKRRTRKQGKIDANPPDTLNLITEVVCASAPSIPVISCSSCRTREAKRVAKKIAARVRPARSDSESAGEDPFGKLAKKPHHEDTNSIIQFNCAEVLDFSTGSVVLPLRITCYCRHHREKLGFLVRFTMVDHVGRTVGTGTSKPIMITDDHKTASASSRHADYVTSFSPPEQDWPRQLSPLANDSASPPQDLRGPTRRRDKTNGIVLKRRPKPYDASAKPGRGSREGSVSSLPSPSTTYSPLPATRSPTPSVLQSLLAASDTVSQLPNHSQTHNIPSLQSSMQSSDTSSPDLLSTPLDHNSDVHMPEIVAQFEQALPLSQIQQSIPSPPILQQLPQLQVLSPLPQPTPAMLLSQAPGAPTTGPLPFFHFESNQAGSNIAAMQVPTIHRLIPNMGPTYGGIEVTVLGANFHAHLNLSCIFGEVVASSTHRWSDNTLVCVLPPRAQPGVVAVWFEGMMEHPPPNPLLSLFTYSDESDRALMELALQVVGLKMTGKIEDAKNVAMRIVGGNPSGSDGQNSNNGNGTTNLMQLSSTPTSSSAPQLNRDLRSLLFIRAGETENFESTVIKFLSILDTPLDNHSAPSGTSTSTAISHPTTSTGQTLLHLAAFMKLPALVRFLVDHDADIDARDKNGYTPLHFAVLARSEECVRVLVDAGVDKEIVNSHGKTAAEIALTGPGFFIDGIQLLLSGEREEIESDGDDGDIESEGDICSRAGGKDEDDEAEWGDAEEDGAGVDEAEFRRLLKRRASKRAMRRSVVNSVNASGRGTPCRSVDISRTATPPLPSVPFAHTSVPPTTIILTGTPKVDETSSSASQSTLEKLSVASPDTGSKQQQPTPYILFDLIQRTLAQLPLPPTTGILPKTLIPKPQLPGLNLPDLNLSNMPGWGALPQIPLVFPVFVFTPAWPSFLGGKEEGAGAETKEGQSIGDGKSSVSGVDTGSAQVVGGSEEGNCDAGGKPPTPNAGEWRAMWEKWLALAIATTAAKQQQQQQQGAQAEDIPPPEYTPRAEDDLCPVDQKGKGKANEISSTTIETTITATTTVALDVSSSSMDDKESRHSEASPVATTVSTTTAAVAGSSRLSSHNNHPVGYNDTPVPAEEVDAYTYQPPAKQKQKQKHKKHDRMLLVFWLPILLLSMIWAFHNGLRFAYTTLRTSLPLGAYMRGNA